MLNLLNRGVFQAFFEENLSFLTVVFKRVCWIVDMNWTIMKSSFFSKFLNLIQKKRNSMGIYSRLTCWIDWFCQTFLNLGRRGDVILLLTCWIEKKILFSRTQNFCIGGVFSSLTWWIDWFCLKLLNLGRRGCVILLLTCWIDKKILFSRTQICL